MTPFERIMEIRTGGATERCHTVLHQGSYSVAAHSWNVAMLMYVLFPSDFPRLVRYCLVHDIPEAWTGDVPSTVKTCCPEAKMIWDKLEYVIFERLHLPNDANLPPDDKDKLRCCDHLELYLWASEQVSAGNQHAACVMRNLDDFFVKAPLLKPAEDLLWQIRRWGTEHRTDGYMLRELTSAVRKQCG